MKKLFCLLVLVFFGCNTDSDDSPLSVPTIEGRWLWAPSPNLPANTMYEFMDGTRYTYYCDTAECDETYWNSLDTSHAIPGTNPYNYENELLTIDLHFGNTLITTLIFECDGNKVIFEESDFSLTRLGSNCE